MSVRLTWVLWLAAAVTAGTGDAGHAIAKDYFLTIGGGYDATGNQMSLERNVVFQQQVLAERRPDKPPHDVFFADGDDESRDVQCRDAEFETNCPPARRMMAEIFGDADSKDLVYRNHAVSNVRGPADKSLLRRRLREFARELQAGDRLIIYVTGHGSEADDDRDDYDYEFDDDTQTWKANRSDPANRQTNKFDTSFYVWDGDAVSASELAGWLDRLRPEVQVVLVMVQCYAGGFAHTIFHQADAELGLSPHARCGFFAQVHDRGAAGCTADANEADYEEYSSYFWGALAGRTRTGQQITTADYNGDGKISFAEAHSYAVLESNTIDIPVRTTGALLRRYSHRGKPPSDDDDGATAPRLGRLLGILGSGETTIDGHELVSLEGSLSRLASRARPDQRAILEQLPPKLGLSASPTVEEIRRRLQRLDVKGKLARAKLSAAEKTYDQLLERAQEEVREIWPELHATYAPLAMELASERADEFVQRVGKLPTYQALCLAEKQRHERSEKQLDLARTEARLQRLLATCEHVVLAANLPIVAPPEIVARYEKLLAIEESTLAP